MSSGERREERRESERVTVPYLHAQTNHVHVYNSVACEEIKRVAYFDSFLTGESHKSSTSV